MSIGLCRDKRGQRNGDGDVLAKQWQVSLVVVVHDFEEGLTYSSSKRT